MKAVVLWCGVLLAALITGVEAETLQLNGTAPSHDGDVRAVAFSPDGQLLASASTDGTIRMWNVETGALIPHSPDSALFCGMGEPILI